MSRFQAIRHVPSVTPYPAARFCHGSPAESGCFFFLAEDIDHLANFIIANNSPAAAFPSSSVKAFSTASGRHPVLRRRFCRCVRVAVSAVQSQRFGDL